MKLRIGTRKSKLALWQAYFIQDQLSAKNIDSEIVEIESFGDQVQDIPLHKLGDKGVFTKALDEALLKDQIDLAVHSLKDVPTLLEHGLVLASVPVREDPRDVLVRPLNDAVSKADTVATGSIRRRAFWLNKFPNDTVSDLRGNVPTRIAKVDEHGWKGAVFALAGLKRLEMSDRVSEVLDWMIPAPAQGAIGIVSRPEALILELLKQIEDPIIRKCVDTERAFLNTLEAGCSSPVGALVRQEGESLTFVGAVLSKDGEDKLEIRESCELIGYHKDWGRNIALKLIDQGALTLMADKAS